jgi:hypothetical protein
MRRSHAGASSINIMLIIKRSGNGELTNVRQEFIFPSLTICLPKLFMGVLILWTKDNTGEPSFRERRNTGRIVKLASRRALPARARQLTS